MDGTIRASQLTPATSSEKLPSVFNILAQENLASSIRPAFQHLVKYLALFKPQTFQSAHRNFDELYMVFDLLLQYYFLKNYGGTFTENFYSMKRVSQETGEIIQDTRDILRTLFIESIVPYLERKLNNLYEKIKEVYEFRTWRSIKDIHSGLLKSFVFLWPHLKTILGAVKALFQLGYLTNRISVHSPWIHFAKVFLKTLTPVDINRFNTVPLHLRTGFFNRIWRFILGLPGVLSRVFAYAMFFVQFLNHIYNTDLGVLSGVSAKTNIPKAPHKFLLSENEVMCLDTNKCPICLKKRVNDTALFVSGYVFCYTCINQYVNTHNKCPITSLPANNHHLIRLFV
ncbi:unnamed protein product [Caenorhabditis bovis]|uniref:Peroxisome assembly protein 12 n=1 Tax=Caenorhabditis bovis TaxID=2654633 RepID=A0A8S1EK01_9PELO|nr:unnamed protein product [Caenorhabditis bovis]